MSKTALAEPAVEVDFQVTEHPHIVRIAGVHGGEPVIRGTRVPVRAIVFHYKAGETLDEILEAYPHVPPAAVVDAISYYLDHQEEIERLMEENQPERVFQKYGLEIGDRGQLRFHGSPDQE